MTGRFAPSPTGDLHLGNLRTAAVAWLSARAEGGDFVVRIEDLDRQQSNAEHEASQLRDLVALGLDWDGPVIRQSERFDIYESAIALLRTEGLVYECYCSRREISEEIAAAPSAPHGPPGSYPGTCRELSDDQRAERRGQGRRPALRLRADGRTITFHDQLAGPTTGVVDDVVLRRNDGVPAYNLAVVVDDGAQEIDEVVRGDDLLSSTARQIHLQRLLGLGRPRYLHVPLVVDADGARLAKRRGVPVTLRELAAEGVPPSAVVSWIAVSLGMATTGERLTIDRLLERFDPTLIPPRPSPAPHFAAAPSSS